jgi:uncharacterized protein (DUF983 family)
MGIAIRRGLGGHCPACGKSHLFNGFLKVVPECRACHAPLGLARADDAPPYLTILITAHIVVPLMYVVDRTWDLSTTSLSAIFLPLTAALTIGMLRPIKGATIGVMVRLNMLKEDAAHI